MKQTKSFVSAIEDLKIKAKHLTEEFKEFTTGYRVLFLLQRSKDGGHNKEEHRTFYSFVTTENDFEDKLFNLLLIKEATFSNLRIYLSVNSRNPKKVIRFIEESLIEAHYSDETNRNNTYKKLLKNPRHFLMQPKCKAENYFIIDIDDVDGEDTMEKAIDEISKLNLEEIKRYKTKNGWHFIVKPFNPALCQGGGEIKKDGLILLDY